MAQVIALKARLDLGAAPDLHKTLVDCAGGDVVLDLSKVSDLGALCLQLMIAAGRDAATAGHGFALRNTSDRVLDQMGAMGITPEMITEGLQ